MNSNFIKALNVSNLSSLTITMRRRLVIILTFPFLVALFLIGWILYCIGGKPKSVKKGHGRKSTTAKKHPDLTTDEEIEIGLIDEIEEKIAA